MTLPVTIPNTFANATTSIPLANLDANFVTIYDAVNGIGNGAESLANVSITGGNVNVTTVTVAAGSNSAPSITTSGDTNTGIFFPAADTIAFAEGGAEAMRIDSSGNVGIGSTSITAIGTGIPTLELKGTSGSFTSRSGGVSLVSQDGTTNKSYIYADTDLYIQNTTATNTRFYTNNTERMRITSAGEVLVGGTTSLNASSGAMSLQRAGGGSFNLFRNDTSVVSGDFFGAINFWGNDTTSNTPTANAYIGAVASGTHAAGDNPTDLVFGVTADGTETVFEALRITQNGTLDSQDTYDNTQTGSTVVVTSAGLIGRTSSSIKYKKDVETLNAELVDNAVANLRPVWYRTKDAKGDDKATWSHIGLIAEEVHEVEPRLVRYRTEKVEFVDVDEQVTKTREVSPAVTDEDGNVVQEAITEEYTETVTRKEKRKSPLDTPEPEDVDYGRLAVLCLAKIQQQEQTIAALEARIAALEAGNV